MSAPAFRQCFQLLHNINDFRLHQSASASGLHHSLDQIIYSEIILFLLSFYKLLLFVRRITVSAFILLNKTRPGSKLNYWLCTRVNCSLSPWLQSGLLQAAVCETALICRSLLLHSLHVSPVPVPWTEFETRSSFIQGCKHSECKDSKHGLCV